MVFLVEALLLLLPKVLLLLPRVLLPAVMLLPRVLPLVALLLLLRPGGLQTRLAPRCLLLLVPLVLLPGPRCSCCCLPCDLDPAQWFTRLAQFFH